MGTNVVGFKGRSGEQIWKRRLELESPDAHISFLHPSSDDSSLHILSASVKTRRVVITQLYAATGVVEKEAWLPAPWLVSMETSCVVVGGVAVCLDPVSQTLFHGSGDRFLRTDLQVSCSGHNFRTTFQDRSNLAMSLQSGIFFVCQTLGVDGVKLLQIDEEGNQFWLHSDHTHWLLGLHDNRIAVATETREVLSYERGVGGRRVGVGVRWEEGGVVQVRVGGGGEEEEEEVMSERVDVVERGRPVQVSCSYHIFISQIFYIMLTIQYGMA